MDNETILNNRWRYTDTKLRDYLKIYKKISSKTQDNIQDIFNSIDFEYIDLSKPISNNQRKKLLRIIDEWKDADLLSGYFGFKVDELIKKRYITNQDMLDILLWGAYIKERNQLDEYEEVLFTEIGQDLYRQGVKEIKPTKKKKWSLTWEYIWSLLCLPNVKGSSWYTYVEALALTNAQEIERQTIIQLQQNKKLNIEDNVYNNIIRKQQNRYISINGNKTSGALDSQVVEIANQSFLKAGKDVGNKNTKARFIAEIDKRTTEMCKGMDNMIFNVNDWNRFYRYSAIDGKYVFYTVWGLEVGINLPPINNHFHYCRSTITYLIDIARAELNKKLQTFNEKNAISKWLSSDFYVINQKMYNSEVLTKEEKKLVKNLYRALNKEPYYIVKDNEMIVRVLEVNDDIIDNIISSHKIGDIYETKAFESYSLKDGYNPNANVYFYIKNSKLSRNMLEYNPDEAEVLYQYGTRFVTKEYYSKNGKHYFLMEEYND